MSRQLRMRVCRDMRSFVTQRGMRERVETEDAEAAEPLPSTSSSTDDESRIADAGAGPKPMVIIFGYKNFGLVKPPSVPMAIPNENLKDQDTDDVPSVPKVKVSAMCKYCKTVICETKGTTSSFNRHLREQHPPEYRQYKGMKIFKKTAGEAASTTSASAINTFFKKGAGKYGNKHPEQLKKMSSFVDNAIINAGLPMAIVENEGFRIFLHDMDPLFTPPSRGNITKTLLPNATKLTMEKLLARLKSVNHAALTLDIWTDRRQHGYLAVTGHTYNARTFTPSSHLLEFQAFKERHTGEAIAKSVQDVISERNLKGKVRYCVSDNASNMKKAFSILGDLYQDINAEEQEPGTVTTVGQVDIDNDEFFEDFHQQEDLEEALFEESLVANNPMKLARLPCFAHTLQLTVKDGLDKLASARKILGKCSKLANIVHQSTTFKTAFEASFGSGRSIPVPNATRWNSLFQHLAAVQKLDRGALHDLLHDTERLELLLTKREHSSLEELVEILSPFAEVTDKLQGENYETLSCVVPSLVALAGIIEKLETTVEFHQVCLRTLKESLYKRFNNIFRSLFLLPEVSGIDECQGLLQVHGDELLYVAAAVLNPSFGFIWLECDHPASDEDKEKLKEVIIGKVCIACLGCLTGVV